MPLYEVDKNELTTFRRISGADGVYERDIEDLTWDNIDAITNEPLFRVRRQAPIRGGGRPDIVALDRAGRVVVIEIKRDIDRGQLAQCLEYAGWAKTTNLDEIATLFHEGADRFFAAWQEFTDSETPRILNPSPRLVLIAADLHGRTRDAMDFLIEAGLPVDIIKASFYEDHSGRRFLDVEWAAGDEIHAPEAGTPRVARRRRVHATVMDLIEAGLLTPGDRLTWTRPRLGERYEATVEADGSIRTEDGHLNPTPSGAAMRVAKVGSYDGWYAWRVPSRADQLLHELRSQLLADREA